MRFLVLCFFKCAVIVLVGAVTAQAQSLPSRPAFTETIESDNAFHVKLQAECDKPSPAAGAVNDPCTLMQQVEPPCLLYAGFAFVYFQGSDLSSAIPMTHDAAKQIWLDASGKIYTDEFMAAVGRLIDVAYSQHSKWESPKDFSDDAYSKCMAGSPF